MIKENCFKLKDKAIEFDKNIPKGDPGSTSTEGLYFLSSGFFGSHDSKVYIKACNSTSKHFTILRTTKKKA